MKSSTAHMWVISACRRGTDQWQDVYCYAKEDEARSVYNWLIAAPDAIIPAELSAFDDFRLIQPTTTLEKPRERHKGTYSPGDAPRRTRKRETEAPPLKVARAKSHARVTADRKRKKKRS